MVTQTGARNAKIILANLKAYLSHDRADKWLADFTENYRSLPGVQVILAVPAFFFDKFHASCSSMENVHLAGQDISPFPLGSYTGSVPAAWLTGLADYVLVGHRERRKYFHETNQDVANKVSEAVAEDIIPIVCLDRKLFDSQISAIESSELDHMIIGYTPDEAESLEVARSYKGVADVARLFNERLRGSPVLYGGGVNKKNIAGLITLPELAGVMVASACLDPINFITILGNAADALARQSKP